jgi:hypothetical protein
MLATLNCLTVHGTERTQQGVGSAMKAAGVSRPDFMPHLFDIGEPIAAPDVVVVVVDVMATSVNDFGRAAVRGRHIGLTDQN